MHSYRTDAAYHRKEETAALLGIMLLIGSVTWTYGGIRSPLQHWNSWSAVTCFLVFLLAPILTHGTSALQFKHVLRRVSNLVNDPLFWIITAFLGFLFTQRFNTGRIKVFDPINATWLYTPPPYPGLPSSIDPEDALDVWRWFFPAGILLITIRHGLKSLWSMRCLMVLMVLHAGCLGMFGVYVLAAHPETTTTWLPPDFFAVFGYPNHAGAFFTLLFGLAVGLAFRFGRDEHSSRRRAMATVMVIMACFFAACAVLAVSRAAMILISFSMLCALGYGGVRFFRELTRAKFINLLLAAIGVAAIGYFWIMGSNAKWVTREVLGLSPDKVKSHLVSKTRTYPLRVAAEIWKDHPVYGTGGWGYRHLGMDYMTEAEKKLILPGSANVHMDALQFLSEFGLVGFSLLVLIPGYLLMPIRNLRWKHPLPLFAGLGLTMVVVASLIDLPFRNAAILCHWVAILTLTSGELSRIPRDSAKAGKGP